MNDDAMTQKIKSSLEEHHGIFPEGVTRKQLREAGCLETVAVLPKDFDARVQYLGNLLVQMLTRSAEIPDDRLRGATGTLAQSLSHLLNSTSWADRELHDFDLDELRRRVKRFGGTE